ncbi:hypothetical protein D3C79_595480 [compost metagenome]
MLITPLHAEPRTCQYLQGRTRQSWRNAIQGDWLKHAHPQDIPPVRHVKGQLPAQANIELMAQMLHTLAQLQPTPVQLSVDLAVAEHLRQGLLTHRR